MGFDQFSRTQKEREKALSWTTSSINLLVVSLANACAKPDAVMVEFHHTVVANIAMGSSQGPENEACLTELKLVKQGRVRQADLHKVDSSCAGDIHVLVGQAWFDLPPAP